MKRHRRSIRLKGYDYTRSGAYFITICTANRECVFGEIVDGEMVLNEYGQIVRDEWFKTAVIRRYVRLYHDEFVVMPNHVHGILWIVDDPVGARWHRAPTLERFGKPVPGSVPTIMRAFKSAVTKRINKLRNTPGAKLWQRNYYEHIIHHDDELHRIREYIIRNPARWDRDGENRTPERVMANPGYLQGRTDRGQM